MTVISDTVEATLHHECSKCHSEMLLPPWVSLEEEAERTVFQCPVCDREAEIDISDYPKTRLRVVVNEWHDSINAQGSG